MSTYCKRVRLSRRIKPFIYLLTFFTLQKFDAVHSHRMENFIVMQVSVEYQAYNLNETG